jgi:hypothetical protein
MTTTEINIVSSATAPVQSSNLVAANLGVPPRQSLPQFGGFRLNYDPQNRELFLVFISSSSGEVVDQIPGFQTISNRRNLTPAASSNLPESPPSAPTARTSTASADQSAPVLARVASPTPSNRGGALNIAS